MFLIISVFSWESLGLTVVNEIRHYIENRNMIHLVYFHYWFMMFFSKTHLFLKVTCLLPSYRPWVQCVRTFHEVAPLLWPGAHQLEVGCVWHFTPGGQHFWMILDFDIIHFSSVLFSHCVNTHRLVKLSVFKLCILMVVLRLPGEESFLCFSVQWSESGSSLGQQKTMFCR